MSAALIVSKKCLVLALKPSFAINLYDFGAFLGFGKGIARQPPELYVNKYVFDLRK